MGSNIRVTKVCKLCGQQFVARKTSTQYCSHKCSQRAYKIRKRAAVEAAHNEGISCSKKFSSKKITKKSPENKLSVEQLHILQYKEFLSVLEVSHLLGVCRATINNYCANGLLKCIKMNRKIFIRRKDIDTLFDSAPPYQVSPKTKRNPSECVKEKVPFEVPPQEVLEFYTAQEAADKYGYCKSTIHKMAARKGIPHVKYEGTYLYHKFLIDRALGKNKPDDSIDEWYSVEEIKQLYAMSTGAVYSFVSEYGIPRKNDRGKTLYSKSHIDAILKPRMGDSEITEWYSMEEIYRIYGLERGYIANFVFKNHIPKKRKGNTSLYSKTHFDEAVRIKHPRTEYISVQDAVQAYGLSRHTIYGIVSRHNIPTVKEGKFMKIQKSKLDKILNPKTLMDYGNANSNA